MNKATATDLAFMKSENPILELLRQTIIRREVEANKNTEIKLTVNHDYLRSIGME